MNDRLVFLVVTALLAASLPGTNAVAAWLSIYSVSPPNNAMNVPINTELSVVLSEAPWSYQFSLTDVKNNSSIALP
jgi:hypothetical protein